MTQRSGLITMTCCSHKIMCCSHKGHRIPATFCPSDMSLEVQLCAHVAETKLHNNLCCTSLKLSGHARGNVAATGPCYILVVCTQCDFVAGTCPSYTSLLHVPFYEQHMILWLQHVAATCPCIMTSRVREALTLQGQHGIN